MPQIDVTYFNEELTIASLSTPAVAESVEAFIKKYEVKYLRSLLGKELADLYIAGIGAPSPDAKWTALKAQLVDSTNKLSPIANYVYCFYRDNNRTSTVSTGESKGVSENSQPVSSTPKNTRAWNEMVDMSIDIYNWVADQYNESDEPIYPELRNFIGIDCEADNVFSYKNSFGV